MTVETAGAPVLVPSNQFPANTFPPPEAIIWRYMSFVSFASLLQTRTLPFTRVDLFKDQHEAVLSRPTLQRVVAEFEERMKELPDPPGGPFSEELKRSMVLSVQKEHMERARHEFYVNCWHANEVESLAMWDLYSQRGVALKSRAAHLFTRVLGETVNVCKITYVDHGSEEVDETWPFLFKRREYAHENEVRAFIKPGPRTVKTGAEAEQVAVEYVLEGLIDEVRVAPGAPAWVFETVCRLLVTYNLTDVPCVRSEADHLPDFLSELQR